jgi:tryptophan-rich hypothetical protein
MNRINPAKLLNSKWTAVRPLRREKHFIVSEVEFDEDNVVLSCLIEAVMSKRTTAIAWHELENESAWLQGWK